MRSETMKLTNTGVVKCPIFLQAETSWAEKPLRLLLWPIIAVVIFISATAYASGSAAGPQFAPPARPDIAPQAQKLLQRACHELASANAFTFHAEVMFDQVLGSGVKLQFAGALDYAVRRNNELAVDYQSDLGGKRLWYDGKSVTLLDVPHKMYASVGAPDSIDAMMDHMSESYHLSLPLGDLAFSNACGKVDKQATFGTWVGINDVLGVPCDHLAFATNNADYQVWLQHNGKPLALKVVINYRALRGSPEYIALISDWKFPATIPQARFQPNLPHGATRIDFVRAEEKKP
jgi:hypothetical protein